MMRVRQLLAAFLLTLFSACALAAQPTEVYVDPSIDGDSGAGTSGDPYGDLEYAIEQTTFDTTNGTRVNIKSGSTETLAADIATAMADTGTTSAWVPSETAPAIFQGYASSAGDGGKGVISGGGSVAVYNDSATDYVFFIDLEVTNTGSNTIITCDNLCSVIRVEFHNTTGGGLISDDASLIVGNYFHNIGGEGVNVNDGFIAFNYFENGTNDFSVALTAVNSNGTAFIYRNIFDLDGSSDGIQFNERDVVFNNSVYSSSGTGEGIAPENTNRYTLAIMNNIVEGFSGAGGDGYDLGASGTRVLIYGNNAAYNNTTEYDAPEDFTLDDWGSSNETLGASPFTNAGSDDFSPVDTGGVKEGSLPDDFGDGQHSGTAAIQLWKGAVEPAEPASGGLAPMQIGPVAIHGGFENTRAGKALLALQTEHRRRANGVHP